MYGHKNTVFFVFFIFLVSGETKVFGLRRHFSPNRRGVYSYSDMSKLAQRSTFVKPDMEPSPENGDIFDEEGKDNAKKMQRSSRRLESNDAEEVHETKMAKSFSRYKTLPPQDGDNVKYPSFPYARSFISVRNATMDDYNEPRNPPEYYQKIWNGHLDSFQDSFQGTSTDLEGSSYNTARRSKVSPDEVDDLSHKTPNTPPYASQKQSVDYFDPHSRERDLSSKHRERTLETNVPTNGTEVSPAITTHDIPGPEVEKVKKYAEFPVDEFEKQFNTIKLEKLHGKQLLNRLRELLDVSKNPSTVYALKDEDLDASAPIHTRILSILNRLSESERIKLDQRHDAKHALKYILQPTNVSLDFKNMVGSCNRQTSV
uniref:Uncharacterized protein n=1 Tax=Timema poppense TaxID=170557 RepID=A0A7R9HEL6_TIMPO|nr:unnamed protein product [Timema poppensis]